MNHKERVFQVLLALIANGKYETGDIREQSGRAKIVILAGNILDEFDRLEAE